VGAFLRPSLAASGMAWGMRLLYDNLFNIILMTIMLNSAPGPSRAATPRELCLSCRD
jgi:hypothetical protein